MPNHPPKFVPSCDGEQTAFAQTPQPRKEDVVVNEILTVRLPLVFASTPRSFGTAEPGDIHRGVWRVLALGYPAKGPSDPLARLFAPESRPRSVGCPLSTAAPSHPRDCA